jgi:hypothetical protein
MGLNCPGCKIELNPVELGVVPSSRLTEETGKRRDMEAKLAEMQKEAAQIRATSDLAATRLALAGGAAPSDRDAKRLRAAWQADIEGAENPPSFADWAAGDGAAMVASLRPVAAPVAAPAGSPPPAAAPVAAPAAAVPNTGASVVADATPGVQRTPAQIQAAQRTLLDQRAAAKARGDGEAVKRLDAERQALFAGATAPVT